jgi:hypothetical protein
VGTGRTPDGTASPAWRGEAHDAASAATTSRSTPCVGPARRVSRRPIRDCFGNVADIGSRRPGRSVTRRERPPILPNGAIQDAE